MNYNIRPPTFTIDTDRLYAGLETSCLQCGIRFTVGSAAWVMWVGRERIGYFCPQCLNDRARAQLAQTAAKVNQRTSDDDDGPVQ